jgi:hypothetical protein
VWSNRGDLRDPLLSPCTGGVDVDGGRSRWPRANYRWYGAKRPPCHSGEKTHNGIETGSSLTPVPVTWGRSGEKTHNGIKIDIDDRLTAPDAGRDGERTHSEIEPRLV